MMPIWFNCGHCFYFKAHTRDSEDGRCYYNILSEEVVTIHFCSKWTCKRCWEQGLTLTNHQICEPVHFESDQMRERQWDGEERRTGVDRRSRLKREIT